MNVRKYWAKAYATGFFSSGKPFKSPIWTGSDLSEDDAKNQLDERVRERVALWSSKPSVLKDHKAERDGSYGISDIVEPCLSFSRLGSGHGWALTRNGYGADTLCAEGLLIADIDCDSIWAFERPPSSSFPSRILDWLGQSFGFGKLRLARRQQRIQAWALATTWLSTLAMQTTPATERALSCIHLVHQRHPELRFRVYRTTRGFRLFETSRIWNPTSSDTQNLLQSLCCDGVYMALCRRQHCFRARLQAKPWRCGSHRPIFRYPFSTPEEADAYKKWLDDYQAKAINKAACHFIVELGSGKTIDEHRDAIDAHDERCFAADASKRLA